MVKTRNQATKGYDTRQAARGRPRKDGGRCQKSHTKGRKLATGKTAGTTKQKVDGRKKTTTVYPRAKEIGGVIYWKASRILSERIDGDKKYYRVQWVGWSPTWEPGWLVAKDAPNLVRHFETSNLEDCATEEYSRSVFDANGNLTFQVGRPPSKVHQTATSTPPMSQQNAIPTTLMTPSNPDENRNSRVSTVVVNGERSASRQKQEENENGMDTAEKSVTLGGSSSTRNVMPQPNGVPSTSSGPTASVIASPSQGAMKSKVPVSILLPELKLNLSQELWDRYKLDHGSITHVRLSNGMVCWECSCKTLLLHPLEHKFHQREVEMFLRIVDAVEKGDMSPLSLWKQVKEFRNLQIRFESYMSMLVGGAKQDYQNAVDRLESTNAVEQLRAEFNEKIKQKDEEIDRLRQELANRQ